MKLGQQETQLLAYLKLRKWRTARTVASPLRSKSLAISNGAVLKNKVRVIP